MTVRGSAAPARYVPASYWEERARRFAVEGNGLAAVCAYGMPEFYNRAIQLEQRMALAPWLRVTPQTRVLDVGCGVGRWSRLLAARGARVTGIDLSPTMIAEARRRALADGVDDRCEFAVRDLATLQLEGRYELVLGVTVLQHILDPAALRAAVAALTVHLAPGGRLVLLEAAPSRRIARCDSTVFSARPRDAYLRMFRECGLDLLATTGVDPAPFRSLLLPHVRRLPPTVSRCLLWLATAASLPVNVVLGRRAVRRSWHTVFVLGRGYKGDMADGA